MVLTEGYDCPPLSAIIMARPTKSGLLYTQCIGRGTRISEGKENLIVIDLTDNSRNHQLVTLPSLFGLKPEFELKGKSITDTLEIVEDLEKKHPYARLNEAESLEDIDKRIEKFDILKQAVLDNSVTQYSRYTWIKSPQGYSIFLSGDNKAKLLITENLLGKYELFSHGTKVTTCDNIALAFNEGDKYLDTNFQDQVVLYRQDARWRDAIASPKQKDLLHKLSISFPDDITKGQASLLISTKLAAR
jgi:hypothetical protein